MNLRVRKWIFKSLAIFTIVVAATVGIGFIILSTQQERLVNIGLKAFNNRFKGELVLGESKVSIFRNFPYVGVSLHNGQLFADKKRSGKPMLEFDRLYVGFSLNDV